MKKRNSFPLNTTSMDLQRVIESVFDDTPELFYVNVSDVTYYQLGNTTAIVTKYTFREQEVDAIKQQIDAELQQLKKQAAKGDAARILHDWLAKNVTYAHDLTLDKVHSIYGVFMDRSAVCDGYSKAYKLLCDAVGIPCIVASGVSTNTAGDTENHAWNILHTAEGNFHVDVTWNSSMYRVTKIPIYYMVSDSFIAKDHTWDRTRLPACTKLGACEKEIIDVVGLRTFADAIVAMVRKRKRDFLLRFNRKFATDQEVLNLVGQALRRRRVTSVTSYSISYIKEQDCAAVRFSYGILDAFF